MEQQTLATALNTALVKQTGPNPACQINNTSFLLAALERSTTCREQIVQRRIGQHHAHPNTLK